MMFLFCWFIFLFWSFLSKTKRVWPFAGHVHGEFFLCTLHNSLMNFFTIFRVKIRALLRPNIRSWTEFDLPIILGVKFWWFSFFTSSPGPLEPELAPLEKSQEICIISEIALKVELAPIDFSLISYWFQKAKWSAHRKNSPWTWPANGQTRLVLLRNDQNKIINQQNRNIISTIWIYPYLLKLGFFETPCTFH